MTSHKCKNQQNFHLVIAPEAGEDQEWGFDDPEDGEAKPISLTLNAVKGIVGVSALYLVGKVKGREARFLADTGATHNFIDPITVNRLNLDMIEVDSFNVTVTGGERIDRGRC